MTGGVWIPEGKAVTRHDYEEKTVQTGPASEPSWVERRGPARAATEYTCRRCGDTFRATPGTFLLVEDKFEEPCPGEGP